MAAIADDGFGEIRQCVAALHSAGLGDGEDAGRGHLPLGTAIAKDDFAQLHGVMRHDLCRRNVHELSPPVSQIRLPGQMRFCRWRDRIPGCVGRFEYPWA